MPDVIAVDVDLRRIHAWSKESGEICYKHPSLAVLLDRVNWPDIEQPTVIMEVSSAQSYQDGDARKLYQKRRWMIYNMAIAGELAVYLNTRATFLVAPSSAWTKGYEEKARHALAKADAKNHDLRECQAMIWSFGVNRKAWVPYRQYLDEIL